EAVVVPTATAHRGRTTEVDPTPRATGLDAVPLAARTLDLAPHVRARVDRDLQVRASPTTKTRDHAGTAGDASRRELTAVRGSLAPARSGQGRHEARAVRPGAASATPDVRLTVHLLSYTDDARGTARHAEHVLEELGSRVEQPPRDRLQHLGEVVAAQLAQRPLDPVLE